MLHAVVVSLLASLAINGLMFLVAFCLRSDKLTDMSYAVTFIVLAGVGFYLGRKVSFSYFIGALLACVWAVRLGSFLFYRVLKTGKDARFDSIRSNFWRFGKFWLAQGVTVWLLMLPLTFLATSYGRTDNKLALLGVVIWALGLVIESVADYQKYMFNRGLHSQKRWIDSGLWHFSRHPNYFGEMLIWIGIYLFCFMSLGIVEKIVGLISPVWICTLLLCISGIPILEKAADEKWGQLAEYREYKWKTQLLIPWPPRRG